MLQDPSYDQVKIMMGETMTEILKAKNDNDENTLLFVYYAGHGAMDNFSKIILNGPRMYPLEKILRDISRGRGSYVVALFDCCREKLPVESTRGLGNGSIADDVDEDFLNLTNQENLVITFGCQPSSGVPQKSTIATAYFRYLRQMSNANPARTGEFALNMTFFKGVDNKCEHISKCSQPLLLQWEDRHRHIGVDKFATGSNFFQQMSSDVSAEAA